MKKISLPQILILEEEYKISTGDIKWSDENEPYSLTGTYSDKDGYHWIFRLYRNNGFLEVSASHRMGGGVKEFFNQEGEKIKL